MITALPYFLTRLDGSSYATSFASWLSVIWAFMSFGSLAYATWTAEDIIPAARIVLPLTINTLLVVFLAITPRITLSPSLFFPAILANTALQAALAAWFQISVVVLASAFGPDAIAAYMTGGALVAIGVSILKIITAHTTLDPLSEWNPRSHSGSSILTGFEFLESLPARNERAIRGYMVYFSVVAGFIACGIAAYAYLHPKIPQDMKRGMPQLDQVESDIEPTEVDYLLGRVSGAIVPMSRTSIWIVARKNACYNIAVFYVFVVTLAVFPAITTSILPVNSPDQSIIFNPLIFSALHFLNFNVADLIGRALSTAKPISPTSDTRLLLYSLARTIFVPLLLLCNVQHKPVFGPLMYDPKPIFSSDVAYMLILFAFGVTNGHASTLILMAAPSKVMNPRLEPYESKTAARIAQFCLVGGFIVGGIVSFGLRAI
ncbi:Equilibrative nucleoside transporter [Ceratobasidium theobromae]|uniref:Equilibrative nucleoside transporter n=1 Tax=Ceratobasidium theobromae TaxID=1582974 RepID=A0A5N5QPU2_9AGAM|nr:Equilibrative nucleoside transporter [Ceratobasidium theobromae]